MVKTPLETGLHPCSSTLLSLIASAPRRLTSPSIEAHKESLELTTLSTRSYLERENHTRLVGRQAPVRNSQEAWRICSHECSPDRPSGTPPEALDKHHRHTNSKHLGKARGSPSFSMWISLATRNINSNHPGYERHGKGKRTSRCLPAVLHILGLQSGLRFDPPKPHASSLGTTRSPR